MLPGNDVLDLEGAGVKRVGELAVFAGEGGPLAQFPFQGRVHERGRSHLASRRFLAFDWRMARRSPAFT